VGRAATGTRLRDLLYVALTFLLIYLAFSWLLESPPPQAMVSTQGSEVVITADRSGHFKGAGTINGMPVNFLVDTGASYLSIPLSMADRLQLTLDRSPAGMVMLNTAAGQVKAYRTVVNSVRFSIIEQQHVAAVVVPKLDQPLLGMNFLSKLHMSQRGGEMVLQVE